MRKQVDPELRIVARPLLFMSANDTRVFSTVVIER
jgi:hypothetical protein